MSFALAWRILTHDKGRTALAIAGVFMAILLVFVELGFFIAVPQGGMLLYDRMRFDLLVASNEYEYQAQPGAFPPARLDAARRLPQVAQATALYFGQAKWESGADGKAPDVFVIGFDPRARISRRRTSGRSAPSSNAPTPSSSIPRRGRCSGRSTAGGSSRSTGSE